MGSLLNGFWIDFEGSWGHCRGVSAGHLATDRLDFGVSGLLQRIEKESRINAN